MTPNEWPIIRTQTCSHPSRWHPAPPPMPPGRPLWLGIVVAAVLIVSETVLVRVLASVEPHNTFGMVYLLGVLVISAGWDTRLSGSDDIRQRRGVPGKATSTRTVAGCRQAVSNLSRLQFFCPSCLLTNALAGRARLRAAEARFATDQVSELAQRQAALRRVATLVARGVSPSEVFTAVADEVANALRVENCVLVRYLGDDSCELVAAHDKVQLERFPVGAVFPWMVTTWRRWCFAPARRPGSTATRTRPARSPQRSATLAFARRWALPLRSTADLGGGGHSLLGAGTTPAPHRSTAGRFRRAGRNRDRQCAGARRTHGLESAHHYCRRRGQASHRARPTRRRTATPCHAEAAHALPGGVPADREPPETRDR